MFRHLAVITTKPLSSPLPLNARHRRSLSSPVRVSRLVQFAYAKAMITSAFPFSSGRLSHNFSRLLHNFVAGVQPEPRAA
jgi:hypothetical protein